MFGYGIGRAHCIVCVVMFGSERGLAHSNARTWVGLRVDLLIYFGENLHKQNA
jgi:hypothetical protein